MYKAFSNILVLLLLEFFMYHLLTHWHYGSILVGRGSTFWSLSQWPGWDSNAWSCSQILSAELSWPHIYATKHELPLIIIDKTRALSDKAPHYPHIAQICDSESQHGDPDHFKYLINCSLYMYHCRAILKIKSTHNMLSRVNGWISDWTVYMVIWMDTKI